VLIAALGRRNWHGRGFGSGAVRHGGGKAVGQINRSGT
jgi:hypothetical protein